MSFLRKAYGLFERGADLLQSPLLLVIRVFWGWQLAQSGWGKLHNINMVVDYFTTLNLPHPALFARAVSALELVGGALLLLGLCSRPIALILTGNMIGAYITADSEAWHSFFAEDSGPFFAAAPFAFLMVSILVLVFGSGLFSADALIARIWKKREAKAV
ncbi:MAG TPA: DoxX family protein [Candidatus Acidoferrales bacterium]|nr:DoxX family protein [Candidatus Acidoferrales bacterium]